MIGDDIEVTVVDIRGDKVRLGVNAPKELSVHRKEVYDAIRRENRAAQQAANVANAGLPPVKVKPQAAEPKSDEPPADLAALAAKYGYTLVKAGAK